MNYRGVYTRNLNMRWKTIKNVTIFYINIILVTRFNVLDNLAICPKRVWYLKLCESL